MNKIQFNITAGTHVGCVRTNNEDNFILNTDLSRREWFLPQDASKLIELGGNGCVLVVADGMGGTNCGEVASAIAVKEISVFFNKGNLAQISKSDKDIEEFLCSAVTRADKAIKKHAKENPASSGMGTTLVVAWVVSGNVHLVWCGDSRAYVYNKVSGLCQLTKDHSYVQSLVDRGELNVEDMFGHPQSNIITRCLGDFDGIAIPDYRLYSLQTNDSLILCTDGLSAYCTDQQISAAMLENANDVVGSRNALLQMALDAGGYDNVTVIVMEVKVNGGESVQSAEAGDAVCRNESNIDKLENKEEDEKNTSGFISLIRSWLRFNKR